MRGRGRPGGPSPALFGDPRDLVREAVLVLLGWQVSVASTQRGLLETTIKNQEAAITQSDQVQAGVRKLASDLMEAAQTDDTAKAIAAKYIKSSGGAAPAASPTK